MEPFFISTIDEISTNLETRGYAFVKGRAPKDDLLNLRREILGYCQDAGWLDTQAELMDGVWSGVGPYTEGQPEFMKVYRHVVNSDAFKALPQGQVFIHALENVLGEDNVLLHKRCIGRITFPQNVEQTIMSHQDWHYIRGTTETYTMWMPVGDCPKKLGCLAVLSGSHKHGFIDHDRFPEKRVSYGIPDEKLPQGLDWHCSDFELGDVLIFHSHTIHKALPNQTPDRLRLSIDNRYQHREQEFEPSSMGTHYDL